jgi:hypothetical protein
MALQHVAVRLKWRYGIFKDKKARLISYIWVGFGCKITDLVPFFSTIMLIASNKEPNMTNCVMEKSFFSKVRKRVK